MTPLGTGEERRMTRRMTIGEIFANALNNAVGTQAVAYDYGDKKTFLQLWNDRFWSCDHNGPDSVEQRDQSRKKSIIIVWDGRTLTDPDSRADDSDPADPLAPHLTPMDWALAFSIRALGQKDGIPDCADVAIHIIDLTGRDHQAWSMRMRHQLLAEMPWVAFHAPLIPHAVYRNGYRPILDGNNPLLTKADTDWELPQGVTLKGYGSVGYGRNLADLTRQWASTLVQSHDHHDLNNLVGPWILAGATTEPEAEELQKHPSHFALRTRLQWTGFLTQKESTLTEPETETDRKPTTSLELGELNVLVIDDQLNSGWDHVICRLFDAEMSTDSEDMTPKKSTSYRLIGECGETHVFGHEKADLLLEYLEDIGKYQKREYDSPITCRDGQQPWLLVLDLLLFPGKLKDEREWIRTLLSIAKRISDHSSGLAWPGLLQKELDDIESWLLGGGTDDPAYDTALSLLSRLCALRWPSVPILLFSGTTRRAVVTKLSDYRNIFLAPPKPNLFAGNSEEQIDVFLGRVVERAQFDQRFDRCPEKADRTFFGEVSRSGWNE